MKATTAGPVPSPGTLMVGPISSFIQVGLFIPHYKTSKGDYYIWSKVISRKNQDGSQFGDSGHDGQSSLR